MQSALDYYGVKYTKHATLKMLEDRLLEHT